MLGEAEMKTTFHSAILVICLAIGACAQGPDVGAGATGLTNASPLHNAAPRSA